MGLAFALGMLVMGLVTSPSGFGRAAAAQQSGLAVRERGTEVPPEWRIEPRAVSFDPMFRATR
jgi:hypothetical protein